MSDSITISGPSLAECRPSTDPQFFHSGCQPRGRLDVPLQVPLVVPPVRALQESVGRLQLEEHTFLTGGVRERAPRHWAPPPIGICPLCSLSIRLLRPLGLRDRGLRRCFCCRCPHRRRRLIDRIGVAVESHAAAPRGCRSGGRGYILKIPICKNIGYRI